MHGCLKDMIFKRNDKLAKEVENKQYAADFLKYTNGKVLGFCERSGMTLSGNNGEEDNHLDNRSSVECGLALEVCEALDVFTVFVERRMNLTKEEVNSVICTDLLDRLLQRTYFRLSALGVLASLGTEQLPRSRTIKTHSEWECYIIMNESVQNTKRSMATGRMRQDERVRLTGQPRGGASGRNRQPTSSTGRDRYFEERDTAGSFRGGASGRRKRQPRGKGKVPGPTIV